MLRPHSPLFNVADEHTLGGGGDAKATFGQQLKAALSSKTALSAQIMTHEATIAGHVTTIEARDATIADLQTKLTAAESRVTALETDAAEVAKALADHKAEVETLKTQEKDLNKLADAKAKEKLGSLGFSASKLPAETSKTPEDGVPATRADLETAMAALPTAQARSELLQKWKAVQAKK